jgi:hypothetical protein
MIILVEPGVTRFYTLLFWLQRKCDEEEERRKYSDLEHQQLIK